MKKPYHAVISCIILITAVFFAAGCSNAVPANAGKVEIEQISVVSSTPTLPPYSPPPTATPTPTPTPTPSPTPDPNKAVSFLTGELIDIETAKLRPYSVVINNLNKALPQSGISQADIYYEVLAEGEITRIIAIFQDFTSAKIGPVRSTREYFADFALDHDAIFVHHGGSDGGYAALRNLKLNNIDGMKYDGTVFQRDPVRVKQSGMYEHSSYTAAERLKAQAEKLKFRLERAETITPMFMFFEEQTSYPDGTEAKRVNIPFSKAEDAHFIFDEATGLYDRFEYGKKHIDEETGGQLAVSNIIVQKTPISLIKGDTYGRRDVALVSKGEGYLFTGGKCVEIKWEKASHQESTKWFKADGAPLELNKGKTWICVIDTKLNPTYE